VKVLLIGGTGVLSTDVALYAIEKRMEVFLLNRGNRPDRLPKGANLIIADIRNVQDVKFIVNDMHFDVIVDFLSYLPEHLKNVISVFENTCKQLIFISSATVYRKKTKNDVITEQTQLSNPFFKYAEDKIECEKLLIEHCKASQLNYTIVRPYVTYGKTRIPFAIIPFAKQWTLINRILLGKPVVMWDEGDAICTLTHTTDFSKGLVGLFENDRAMQNAFHITSNENFTWKEVLKIIAETVNKEVVVANIPSKYIGNEIPKIRGELLGDKATHMIFDNRKIKKAVPEFVCTTNFKDGIKQTIDFYKRNPIMMQVDYTWDAQMDHLIKKYYKKNKPSELKRFTLKYIPEINGKFHDKLIYIMSKYKVSDHILRLLAVIQRICRNPRLKAADGSHLNIKY